MASRNLRGLVGEFSSTLSIATSNSFLNDIWSHTLTIVSSRSSKSDAERTQSGYQKSIVLLKNIEGKVLVSSSEKKKIVDEMHVGIEIPTLRPFQLQITASVRERPLRATWALQLLPTWLKRPFVNRRCYL